MKYGCVNGTLEEGDYSIPVPSIGLYIAAGTFVCFLFILFDIVSAFRRRKTWIPCRLFSLNSITLTLLSICLKLPVDLTTPMPSVQDQLSKLTATTLLCTSMGFLSPSVGNNGGSDYITDMAALSVLVITVAVNICIQLSTGVIHHFVVEHIVIVCCMLILLLFLWYSASDSKHINESFLESNKRSIVIGNRSSMLDRLKACYLQGFVSNPQLRACRGINNFTMTGLCLISFCVLTQATVKSLVLKKFEFCGGASDYGWSMWIIVVTQSLTVVVGCFAISFRWIMLFPQMEIAVKIHSYKEDLADRCIRKNPMLGADPWHKCRIYIQEYVWYFVLMLSLPIRICALPFANFFEGPSISDRYKQDSVPIQEFKHLFSGVYSELKLNDWTMQTVANEYKTWMKVSKKEPLEYLPQILLRPQLSQQWYITRLDAYHLVSILPMTVLVKLVIISCPINLTKSLVHSFNEAFEIINFIQIIQDSSSLHKRVKRKLAKAVLIGDGFQMYLPPLIERSGKEYYSQSELERALMVLRYLYPMKPEGIENTLLPIVEMIIRQEHGYRSIQDLYNFMEQIYVYMLHSLLAQLPLTIFKYVTESPFEEFEDRTKVALKLLWKIKSSEHLVNWSFPVVRNLSCMIERRVCVSGSQDNTVPEEGSIHISNSFDAIEEGEIVPSTGDDGVIIQVEETK